MKIETYVKGLRMIAVHMMQVVAVINASETYAKIKWSSLLLKNLATYFIGFLFRL